MMKISAGKKLKMLPSLKERKRYVVFESERLDFESVKSGILENFSRMFGVSGAAGAGIQFIDWKDCRGIIRAGNKDLDRLRASFVLNSFFIRSVGVSGTLRKARERYFGRDYLLDVNLKRRGRK